MKILFFVTFYLILIIQCYFVTSQTLDLFDSSQIFDSFESSQSEEVLQNIAYKYDETNYLFTIETKSKETSHILPFNLPFYGFYYNEIKISLNGYIELSSTIMENTTNATIFDRPSTIGIFKTNSSFQKTTDDKLMPGVYFRVENLLDLALVDTQSYKFEKQLQFDINKKVLNNFRQKSAIIITWNQLSPDNDDVTTTNENNNLTNTFQLILTTDFKETYALFNYIDMNWQPAKENQSDMVFFTAGNGTKQFQYKKPLNIDKNNKNISDNEQQQQQQQQRHLFKINEDIISYESCGELTDTRVSPSMGNMLGGTVVTVTGPCFSENDVVECDFANGQGKVTGLVVRPNQVECVQPMLLNVEGYIEISLLINSEVFLIGGQYYVAPPDTYGSYKVDTETNFLKDMNMNSLAINWRKDELPDFSNVRVTLWGFYQDTYNPKLKLLQQSSCGTQDVCTLYSMPPKFLQIVDSTTVGVIEISKLNDSYSQKNEKISYTKIWSKPIDLGWFFNEIWRKDYGQNWPEIKCKNWIRSDKWLNYNFNNIQLPKCPCTLEKISIDLGNFKEIPYSSQTDFYYSYSLMCYESLFGNKQQLCCYNSFNKLVSSFDDPSLSHLRLTNVHGKMRTTSFENNTIISGFGTLQTDYLPYLMCCQWNDLKSEECQQYKYERRVTRDCTINVEQSPSIAGVLGAGQIITFNGEWYPIYGVGDYVLSEIKLITNQLTIYGRFREISMNYEAKSGGRIASVLSSVVINYNVTNHGKNKLEIKLQHKNAQHRNYLGLDIFLNERNIYFDEKGMDVQRIDEIIFIYVLKYKSIIIAMSNGAAVEVTEENGFMTINMHLPPMLALITKGLLGRTSKYDKTNFILPNGVLLYLDTKNHSHMHNSFVKKWQTISTLNFIFDTNYDLNIIENNDLTADVNLYGVIPINDTETYEYDIICNGLNVNECRFDYQMTNNNEMARITAKFSKKIWNKRESASFNNEIFCNPLKPPLNGIKSTNEFTAGTLMQFECFSGYQLHGSTFTICQENGLWTEGTPYCLKPQMNRFMTGSIILAGCFLAIVILALFLAFMYSCCCRRDSIAGDINRKLYSPVKNDDEEAMTSKWDKQS